MTDPYNGEAVFTARHEMNFKIITDIKIKNLDCSVGIATRYSLDGPEIESRWGRDFPHTSRPALGHNQPPVQWVPGLSRGKTGRGVALTTHPM
jgi:hypothetical protein